MTKLSQNRAKDRMIMATRLRELAERFGFTAEIDNRTDAREVYVKIKTARGLNMSTHLEAGACAGFFMGHWFMDTGVDTRLCMSFAADCGGSVNEFHQRKATTSAPDDFEEFIGIVERCLEAIKDDAVFEDVRHPTPA